MLKVTLITPSLDQAGLLPASLGSVSAQTYPEVEHRVVDGGSTDGSVDFLKEWRQPAFTWTSEPDAGPADAINKALRSARGDVVGCLGLGATLAPDAVARVARHFDVNPGVQVVCGRLGRRASPTSPVKEMPSSRWGDPSSPELCACRQPAVFWRRELTVEHGVFDERLRHAYDMEYWLRVGKAVTPAFLGGPPLAILDAGRAGGLRAREETLEVVSRHVVARGPVYAALRTLARLRAALECNLRAPEDGVDSRYRMATRRWFLLYAERYRISLDEPTLLELSSEGPAA
jgi:glycosyltransferase involved in cell wall biosynthesis